MRTLTEILASAMKSRCDSSVTFVERRFGLGAGTQNVMSALHTMAVDPSVDAFVVAATDVEGPSSIAQRFDAVGAVLVFTRTGTRKGQVCVIGAHEIRRNAKPWAVPELPIAMSGALERSGSAMADIDGIVISIAGGLTRHEVHAAARSLFVSWNGRFLVIPNFTPLRAAEGAFDLSYHAQCFASHATHGQRFLWVSRSSASTCAVVLTGRRSR